MKDTFTFNQQRAMFLTFTFRDISEEDNKLYVKEMFQNITKVDPPTRDFMGFLKFSNIKIMLQEVMYKQMEIQIRKIQKENVIINEFAILIQAYRQDYLGLPSKWMLWTTDYVENITEEMKVIIRSNVTSIALISPISNFGNNTIYEQHATVSNRPLIKLNIVL